MKMKAIPTTLLIIVVLISTYINSCTGQQSESEPDETNTVVAISEECVVLNANAARLKNESYCSLYDSIIQYGTIFAGNVSDTTYACANRHACIGNFTEVMELINTADNCTFQQDTDEMVTFMTELYNNREILGTMTDFICGNETCYNDIRDEVAGCRDTYWIKSCDKTSTTPECFDSILDMVDSLSEEERDEVIGADWTLLNSMKRAGEGGGEGAQTNTTTTTATNDAASWISSSIVMCILGMVIVISSTTST